MTRRVFFSEWRWPARAFLCVAVGVRVASAQVEGEAEAEELVIQSRDNNRITAFRQPKSSYQKYRVYAVYADKEFLGNSDVFMNFIDYVVLIDIQGTQLIFTPIKPANEHEPPPLSAMQVGYFLTPTERVLRSGTDSRVGAETIPRTPNVIPYHKSKLVKVSPRINLTFIANASYIMSGLNNTKLLEAAEEEQPNNLLKSIPGNSISSDVFSGLFLENLSLMLRYRPILMGLRIGVSSRFYYKPKYKVEDSQATSLQYTPYPDYSMFGVVDVVVPFASTYSVEMAFFLGGGLATSGSFGSLTENPNLVAEAGLMFSIKTFHLEISAKTLDAANLGGSKQDFRLGLGLGLSLKPFQDFEKGIEKDDQTLSEEDNEEDANADAEEAGADTDTEP